MIIDVDYEDGTTQIARTVVENNAMFAINFLELKKVGIYDFSSNTELISKESVSGFYDVDNLESTDLFVKVHKDMNLSMIVKMKISNAQIPTRMTVRMMFH